MIQKVIFNHLLVLLVVSLLVLILLGLRSAADAGENSSLVVHTYKKCYDSACKAAVAGREKR